MDDTPEPYPREARKVGRNDPCPCGSGRKYKRCCLAQAQPVESVEDIAWRRLRRLLDEHQGAMLRFFRASYASTAIDEAWSEFTGEPGAVFDPDSPHLQMFVPWLSHFWSPRPGGVPPSARYLEERARRLDPLLRAYLESCLAAPLGVYEIERVDPGRGFRLRDLFTAEAREVIERRGSEVMEKGDLVLGQIAQAGGVAILEACQAFIVSPIHKLEAIALRRRLFPDGEAPAPARLRERHAEVLALYREIARRVLEPPMPQLRNTDGEALSPRRVVFDVPSAQAAFDALKHLALGESDEELLREAAREADGTLSGVRFPWLKKGNAQHPDWENTILGRIEIEGTRLTVQVNSEERERRLRELVAAALPQARYRASEIRSLERMLAEAPARSEAASDESARLAELPEVKAKLAEMTAKFYDGWVNQKIPLLGGRTPLEAVADRDGREAVEALLAQIERDGSRMKPPLDPEVVKRLRERLGLR